MVSTPGLDELPAVHFEFLNTIGQIDNGFFNRPIIAHAQILVHSWGPRRIRIHGTVSQTDLYNQSLVSSVVQVKLLACCYGFMSEVVTSADIILL